MELSFEQMAQLPPASARRAMPAFLRGYANLDAEQSAALEARLRDVVDRATDAEIERTLAALAFARDEYQLYEADPLARVLTRLFMEALVGKSEVVGLTHLEAALEEGPVLVLSNHLSYVDTQVTDLLLVRAGAQRIVDSMVAIAGPKVYETPFRRMAAMGLNTLKTAQSTSLAHNAAALTPREVGRIALNTIQRSQELMAQGRPVLLYGEGSRSRDRRLQPFLKGVAKYARLPGLHVVPLAVTGSELLFPVDAPTLDPGPASLSFGAPVAVSGSEPIEAVRVAWRAVAEFLPEAYRPGANVTPIA